MDLYIYKLLKTNCLRIIYAIIEGVPPPYKEAKALLTLHRNFSVFRHRNPAFATRFYFFLHKNENFLFPYFDKP